MKDYSWFRAESLVPWCKDTLDRSRGFSKQMRVLWLRKRVPLTGLPPPIAARRGPRSRGREVTGSDPPLVSRRGRRGAGARGRGGTEGPGRGVAGVHEEEEPPSSAAPASSRRPQPTHYCAYVTRWSERCVRGTEHENRRMNQESTLLPFLCVSFKSGAKKYTVCFEVPCGRSPP